jgi:hypothetical protein
MYVLILKGLGMWSVVAFATELAWGGAAVFEVLVDGTADGCAPGVGAQRADVLVLGKMDGLGERLGEIGEGCGRREV